MRKTRTKNKTVKRGLLPGDLVVCINDKPKDNSGLRRIALVKDSKYLVIAKVYIGADKRGPMKDTVLVSKVVGQNIEQLKNAYFWDSARFKKLKSGYFKSDNKERFLSDDEDLEVSSSISYY